MKPKPWFALVALVLLGWCVASVEDPVDRPVSVPRGPDTAAIGAQQRQQAAAFIAATPVAGLRSAEISAVRQALIWGDSAGNPAWFRAARRAEAAATAAAAVTERKAFAAELDTKLLESGVNSVVTTKGATATTLHVFYVLASRAWAHNFVKALDQNNRFRAAGFRRVEVSDRETIWSWDYETQPPR